jgi:hypothetical protein
MDSNTFSVAGIISATTIYPTYIKLDGFAYDFRCHIAEFSSTAVRLIKTEPTDD